MGDEAPVAKPKGAVKKYTITKEASKFAFHVLFDPYQLPLAVVGIPRPDGKREPLAPFKASKRRERRAMRALRKSYRDTTKPKEDKNGAIEWVFEAFEWEISERHAEVLLSLVEHYEAVGSLVEWCEGYEELFSVLKEDDDE